MTVQWQERWLGSFGHDRQMGRDIRIRSGESANKLTVHYRWMTTLPCYRPIMISHYQLKRFEFIVWQTPRQESQQQAA